MSVRHLESLFHPSSVAVVGASDRPRSVGAVVMQSLLAGGFTGPILPVNPGREAVAGVLAYPDVTSLPIAPGLAVIATPPETVADLVGALGRRGTRALAILTGLGRDRKLQRTLLESAERRGLRLLGPNCLGIVVAGAGLNASFAHVVSLGESLDVDAGDLLDYLGADPRTRAILLYLESVPEARKFLSAARAAARDADLLVMPTDGRDGFLDVFRGSHTERVVRTVDCPLLAVPTV